MNKKIVFLMTLLLLCVWVVDGTKPVEAAELLRERMLSTERIKKIRMTWPAVQDAVMYQLLITKGESDEVIKEINEIYTLGYELDTSLIGVKRDQAHWRVRALDINKKPLSRFSDPKPLLGEEINPTKPMITGEYEKLPYSKIYPVYSWIPVAKADQYEIQIFKDTDRNSATKDVLVRSYKVDDQRSSNYYDDDAYVAEGVYWWRIIANNMVGRPISDWSERKYFIVNRQNVGVAAIGDSITHGGGAVTVPPTYTMYDWETYTGVPILNIGLSGDTVEKMSNRFKRDVVPFSPKVLVIMGGINNIRLDDRAEVVIRALTELKYKCIFYKIIPVFVTIPPINPPVMKSVSNINVSSGWQVERQKINHWIVEQNFHVDVTPELTDVNGLLKNSLSTDGLHPDSKGKKIIGKEIGYYLRDQFDYMLQ